MTWRARWRVRMLLLGLLGLAAQPALADDYLYSTDWTSRNTQVWQKHLEPFAGKPGVQGLEIGCFEGRSSIWFLEHVATHPTARMTCIDVFTGAIEQRFDHNVRVSGLGDRLSKRKGYSQDVLRTLELGSYDFAYVDGCHLAQCVLTDAVLIWDLLKPGGILIFDDYLWNLDDPPSQRPKMGVDAFLSVFRERIHLRAKAYQVVVEKKGERSDEELVGNPVVHSESWEERFGKEKAAGGG